MGTVWDFPLQSGWKDLKPALHVSLQSQPKFGWDGTGFLQYNSCRSHRSHAPLSPSYWSFPFFFLYPVPYQIEHVCSYKVRKYSLMDSFTLSSKRDKNGKDLWFLI